MRYRQSDRQTDQPTDRHRDLQSRVHATKNGEGRIREKVIVYELISYGNTEIQISALGGHGFPVFTPQVIV